MSKIKHVCFVSCVTVFYHAPLFWITYQVLYKMSLVYDVLCFVSCTTTSLSELTILSIISHSVSYQILLFSIRCQ